MRIPLRAWSVAALLAASLGAASCFPLPPPPWHHARHHDHGDHHDERAERHRDHREERADRHRDHRDERDHRSDRFERSSFRPPDAGAAR
jgi:hypothetical protein